MRNSALLVLLAALAFSGCFNFTKPKPIASEVEATFKECWVAKRASELQANGTATAPSEARKTAITEFNQKFEYTSVAKKTDQGRTDTP
jgi:hypothetical protein